MISVLNLENLVIYVLLYISNYFQVFCLFI